MTKDLATDSLQTPMQPAKKKVLRRWLVPLCLIGVAAIATAVLGPVDGIALAVVVLLPVWIGYLVARSDWAPLAKTGCILLLAFVPLVSLVGGIYLIILDVRYPNTYEVKVNLEGIQLANIARIQALALEEASQHRESGVKVDFEKTSNSLIVRVSPERFAPLVELQLRRASIGKVKGISNGAVEIDTTHDGFRLRWDLEEQIKKALNEADIDAKVESPGGDHLIVRINMGERNFRNIFRPAGSDTRIAVYRADFDQKRIAEAIAYGAPAGQTLETVGSRQVLRHNKPSLHLGNAIARVQIPDTSPSITSNHAIRFNEPERSQLSGLRSFNDPLLVKCEDQPFTIGQVLPNGLLATSGVLATREACLPAGSGPAFLPIAPISIRKLR